MAAKEVGAVGGKFGASAVLFLVPVGGLVLGGGDEESWTTWEVKLPATDRLGGVCFWTTRPGRFCGSKDRWKNENPMLRFKH